MKTIKTLTTIILVAFSATVFAGTKGVNSTDPVVGIIIERPDFNFGNPDDINDVLIVEPSFMIKAPELGMGSPEDIYAIPFAVEAPEMEFGSTDDTGLVLAFPEFAWGAPEDLIF